MYKSLLLPPCYSTMYERVYFNRTDNATAQCIYKFTFSFLDNATAKFTLFLLTMPQHNVIKNIFSTKVPQNEQFKLMLFERYQVAQKQEIDRKTERQPSFSKTFVIHFWFNLNKTKRL